MSRGQLLPSYPTVEEVSSRVTQAETRLLAATGFVKERLDEEETVKNSALAVAGVAAILLHSTQDPMRVPPEVNYILRSKQFQSEFIVSYSLLSRLLWVQSC